MGASSRESAATSPCWPATSGCASSCRASSTSVNRDRSRYEQIKRFVILPRDFTMEHDEMTPTLKLKRRVVLEHFADAVDELYERSEDVRLATTRLRSDGRRRRRSIAVQQRDLDHVAGVRGVDELSPADVDADVSEPVEEDEVAGLQVGERDGCAVSELRGGVVRERDADLR